MADWSPTGAPYAISERASASAELEHAYRRLVRLYPRSFRSENTEEIIAVLLATAREDQRRPTVMEAADLLRGAARMRLGLSGCPRTVLSAVRLMYLGALAEVAVLVSALLSIGHIEAAGRALAIASLGPHPSGAAVQQATAQAAAVVGSDLTGDVAITVFAIAAWLFFAWGNRQGSPYARSGALIVCAAYVAVTTLSLAKGNLSIAPAAVIASVVVMAIGVAVNILLLAKPSWPYYQRHSVAR
jgi:hypothetical protein